MNIQTKNKYVLEKAENYLCVAATLKMVIFSGCQKEISQDDIANFFGINLPVGDNVNINIKNVKYTDNSKRWGIIIEDNAINNFFIYNNIKMKETYIRISEVPEEKFVDTIVHLIGNNTHIICGFDYNHLYKTEENDVIGHVSVIIGADDTKVFLLDPGPRSPGVKQVLAYDLFIAIRRANDGFWCISDVYN